MKTPTGIAAAVLLTTLALTGCTAPPSTPGGTGNTGDGGAATSGPADGGDTGGELAVPATFPSDVPLIEGDVTYAQDLGTGWVVYIARDDFLGGYEEAKGLLVDAGFTGDTINQDDTGAVGQFVGNNVTVNLSAGDGSDLGVGPSVGYTVVKNG